MKVKIRKDRHTGETHIEYYNVADKTSFRFDTLNRMLKDKNDITIIIDTNQRVKDLCVDGAESILEQSGIKYKIIPAQANKTSFFGIPISLKNKNSRKEYIMILNISSRQFTRELFYSILHNYDIALGLGSKEPFEKICESLRSGAEEVLFDSSFFEESVYDSILCASMRCSFDIGTLPEIK